MQMGDVILKILDVAKVPIKVILLAACALTGVFLLVRDCWIIADFMNDYGKFVGAVFVGSGVVLGVLLVVDVGVWGWKSIQGARREAAMKKAVSSSIDSLDNHEKAVLREFHIQGKSTVLLPITDPVVKGLLWKNIIVIVGHYGKMSLVGMLSPVSLSSFASTLINPQTVGIPPGKLTQEQIKKIMNSRPSFVREMERSNW